VAIGRGTGNSGNKHPGRGGGGGGGGGGGFGGPNTGGAGGIRGRDKSIWVELIRCLEKRELLPMAQRCRSNPVFASTE
jgi:hypothetical protein